MNYIDLLIALPLLWAIYRGFTKGFVVQAASLVGVVVGIWAALKFSDFTGSLLHQYFGWNGAKTSFVSFIITFFIVLILVHIIARLIDKLLHLVALGIFNRIMGVVFAVAKMVFIVSVALYLLNFVNERYAFVKQDDKDNSFLYDPIAALAPSLFPIFDNPAGTLFNSRIK